MDFAVRDSLRKSVRIVRGHILQSLEHAESCNCKTVKQEIKSLLKIEQLLEEALYQVHINDRNSHE